MNVVPIKPAKTDMWRVRVGFENGTTVSLSDVVGVVTDDPDFVQVMQESGDYVLVFHTGRPQFMEVTAQ